MEKLLLGIRITIIGMGVTYVSLFLLSLIMQLMHRLYGGEKKTNAQDKPVDNTKPAPVQTTGEKEQVPVEVVAVIASALASYLEKAPAGVKIRVIRRQIPFPLSTWSMAGRQELMNQRQIV